MFVRLEETTQSMFITQLVIDEAHCIAIIIHMHYQRWGVAFRDARVAFRRSRNISIASVHDGSSGGAGGHRADCTRSVSIERSVADARDGNNTLPTMYAQCVPETGTTSTVYTNPGPFWRVGTTLTTDVMETSEK